ncbi:hypothetical protein, partial [Pseudonocardia pini]|uniref:hypothetical protein n=1 Tax=Pseudonocardia pini TaxID=2758030 RepID=UPI0015F0FD23
GGHRVAGADSGAFPAAGRTATAVSDSGGHPSVSETGRRRRVRPSDTGSMARSASSASGSFRFDDLLGDGRADTRSPHTPTRGLTR